MVDDIDIKRINEVIEQHSNTSKCKKYKDREEDYGSLLGEYASLEDYIITKEVQEEEMKMVNMCQEVNACLQQ